MHGVSGSTVRLRSRPWRARLRDGGPAGRHERHGRADERIAAGLDAHGDPGEGRGIDLPRQPVRAGDRPVPAKIRQHGAPVGGCPGRSTVSPQEIQGSDHKRRLPVARRQLADGPARSRGAGRSASRPKRNAGQPGADTGRCQSAGRRFRPSGRPDRRDLQKQGSVDQAVQRAQSLQRVGVRLPSDGAAAGAVGSAAGAGTRDSGWAGGARPATVWDARRSRHWDAESAAVWRRHQSIWTTGAVRAAPGPASQSAEPAHRNPWRRGYLHPRSASAWRPLTIASCSARRAS